MRWAKFEFVRYFNIDTKNILDFSVKIQGFVFHFWRENSKLRELIFGKKVNFAPVCKTKLSN